MTSKEAIEVLNTYDMSEDNDDAEFKDAVALAIKALEQEPCDDCIDRAELLKAIDTWDKFGCDADTKLVPYKDHYVPYIHYDDVIKCIIGMPSVKPQEPNLKALGEELRSTRKGIKGDQTLVGYNLALSICNKYLSDSEEQEPRTDYKAFAEWVAGEIFSKEWEFNKDSFAEVACRKLSEMGIVKADGENWALESEGEE